MDLEYYLHYHYANYKKQGVTRGGSGSPIKNWESLIEKQRQNVLRTCQSEVSTEIKDLENCINYFTIGKWDKQNGPIPMTEDQIATIRDYLTQYFINTLDLVDREAAFKSMGGQGVALKHNGQTISQDAIRSMKKSKKGSSTYITTSSNAIQQLNQMMAESQVIMDAFYKNPRKAEGMAVRKQWKKIKRQMQSLRDIMQQSNGKHLPTTKTMKYGGTIQSFYQELRSFAQTIYLQNSLNALSGEFNEQGFMAIAATVEYNTQKIQDKTLGEFIKEFNAKHNTSKQINNMTIQAKLLGVSSEEEYNKLYGKEFGTWSQTDGVATVTLRGGQDKVDANLAIGQFSLKNITFHGDSAGIHLTSSTPLVKTILDEPVFGYHYLNNAIRNVDGDDRNSVRESANMALKKMLLLYAIAGYEHQQGRQKGADYFSVHDKTTGETKIYSIEAILQTIMKKSLPDEIQVKLNGSEFGTTEAIITQRWAETYPVRIASVMNTLKNITASVTLDFSKSKFDPSKNL